MKRTLKIVFFATIAASLFTSISSTSASQELELTKLPMYQAPVPYAGIRNWHLTQNLGPTGARGWVYGHNGHSRDSREILVKSVEPGSPADGVLRPYDIIIGAAVPPNTPSTEWKIAPAVKPFDSDARLSLARAITWAESTSGKGQLKLLRNRDGKVETVTIPLPVIGDYSKTAPFDCTKSDRIVKDAAQFLAEQMPVEGFSTGVGSPIAAALLLATGDEAYLDHVRRSAYQMSVNHTITDAGHETWRWGNTNTFLTEYYLATGDKRVLPTIEEYCKRLAEGQCNPGTWGHRVVPDFIPPGYGSLNSSGLVCFISLILGKQIGVEGIDEAILNSIRFYGSYAGRGGIPYGDHPPYNNATSNGKNGMAAVAFGLLRVEPAEQWFARMAGSTNLTAFESGHSGNYFNQLWTPLGARLAGRQNYINFWSRFNSYRDLARRRDGSFLTQPWPHKREGDLGTGNYVRRGPMWSTGGFALSYLAGSERLAILGRTDSVFAANAPSELKEALDLYHAKQFEECSRMAASITEKTAKERVRQLAGQLDQAAQRNLKSIELTCQSMETALAAGDLYKLKWQLLGIESIMDPNDPRLDDFRDAITDPDDEEVLSDGAKYYKAVAGANFSGTRGFELVTAPAQTNGRDRSTLQRLAEDGEAPYDEMAEAYLEAYPALVLTADKPLLPPPSDKNSGKPDTKATCWQYLKDGKTFDEYWKLASFIDSGWENISLPSKEVGGKGLSQLRGIFEIKDPDEIKGLSVEFETTAPFKAYLNGELVLDETGGKNWKRTVTIPLKPITRELLKKGDNCLAVEGNMPNSEAGGFKLALKATLATESQ